MREEKRKGSAEESQGGREKNHEKEGFVFEKGICTKRGKYDKAPHATYAGGDKGAEPDIEVEKPARDGAERLRDGSPESEHGNCSGHACEEKH